MVSALESRISLTASRLCFQTQLAPLLLGMYDVKNELEDLAFKWSAPENYAETARWFDELSKKQEPVVRSRAQKLQAVCDGDQFLQVGPVL